MPLGLKLIERAVVLAREQEGGRPGVATGTPRKFGTPARAVVGDCLRRSFSSRLSGALELGCRSALSAIRTWRQWLRMGQQVERRAHSPE